MSRLIFILFFIITSEVTASTTKGVFLKDDNVTILDIVSGKELEYLNIKILSDFGKVNRLYIIDEVTYLAEVITGYGLGEIFLVNKELNKIKLRLKGRGLNLIDENTFYFLCENKTPCLFDFVTEEIIVISGLDTIFSSLGYMQPLLAKVYNSDLYLSLGYPNGIGVLNNESGVYRLKNLINKLKLIDVGEQGVLTKDELGKYYFIHGDKRVVLDSEDLADLNLMKIVGGIVFGTKTEFSLLHLSEIRKIISFDLSSMSLTKSFNYNEYGAFLNFH